MDPKFALLTIALAVIGGLISVGAVLAIKITRRRQATHGEVSEALDTGVPAQPMTQAHARYQWRNYCWVATVVLTLLSIVAIMVFTQ